VTRRADLGVCDATAGCISATRPILLAAPVRLRLTGDLDYRQTLWSNSSNPHLFIYVRNHDTLRPVALWWIRK